MDLPPFVCQLPEASDVHTAAWQAARLKYLQDLSQNLPSQEQLDTAADVICQAACHGRLNYAQYTRAIRKVQTLDIHLGLRPSAFLQLQCDDKGSVPVGTLLAYILQRSSMCRLRVHASCYDVLGTGYLTAMQLLAFVQHLLLRLTDVAEVEQSLPLDAYAVLASARLSLSLSKAGRVPVGNLVTSAVLSELLQAASRSPDNACSGSDLSSHSGHAWFSPPAAGELWTVFLEHAAEEGPALSQDQFSRSCSGSMTASFRGRAFDELCSRECQPVGSGASRALRLGFAGFAAFHAAWQHRAEPGALRHLFPCLCRPGCSYLAQEDVLRHVTEVLGMWQAEVGPADDLRPEDVCDEVFDVVKPRIPGRITCADLVDCGMGGEVLGIMVDVAAFYDWESQEQSMQQIDLA